MNEKHKEEAQVTLRALTSGSTAKARCTLPQALKVIAYLGLELQSLKGRLERLEADVTDIDRKGTNHSWWRTWPTQ